jgi:hypothetical protein
MVIRNSRATGETSQYHSLTPCSVCSGQLGYFAQRDTVIFAPQYPQ